MDNCEKSLKRPLVLKEPQGESTCGFFLEKKRRFCRLSVTDGSKFCVQHIVIDDASEGPKKRTPCPYDPRHTVDIEYFDHHLKRCNGRPRTPEPYFSKDLNGVGVVDQGLSLAQLEAEDLDKILKKISIAHSKIVKDISKSYSLHPVPASELIRNDIGPKVAKHISQTASLLNLLEVNQLLTDDKCFIEFGSGKGSLTYWMGQVGLKSEFVLLDRASHRHKQDNKLKGSDFAVTRIRIDIQHLRLAMVPSVAKGSKVVGVSKHLCGGALDMALKCLLETNDAINNVSGIIFATCCHHQCTWSRLFGKNILENLGFNEKDFKSLAGIAGWATCGTGTGRFDQESNDIDDVKINNELYSSLGLRIEDRRRYGLMVKELIDTCRAEGIRSFGLNASLVHYVDSETTYENVAIVATRHGAT